MTDERWNKLQALALHGSLSVSRDYLLEALGAIRELKQVEKDAAKVVKQLSKKR